MVLCTFFSSLSIYLFDLQFSFDIAILVTHTYCPLHHTHPLYFGELGAIFRDAIRSRVKTWTRWHWVLSLGDVNPVVSTSFLIPTGDIELSAQACQWAGHCWVEMLSPVSFLPVIRWKKNLKHCFQAAVLWLCRGRDHIEDSEYKRNCLPWPESFSRQSSVPTVLWR